MVSCPLTASSKLRYASKRLCYSHSRKEKVLLGALLASAANLSKRKIPREFDKPTCDRANLLYSALNYVYDYPNNALGSDVDIYIVGMLSCCLS